MGSRKGLPGGAWTETTSPPAIAPSGSLIPPPTRPGSGRSVSARSASTPAPLSESPRGRDASSGPRAATGELALEGLEERRLYPPSPAQDTETVALLLNTPVAPPRRRPATLRPAPRRISVAAASPATASSTTTGAKPATVTVGNPAVDAAHQVRGGAELPLGCT